MSKPKGWYSERIVLRELLSEGVLVIQKLRQGSYCCYVVSDTLGEAPEYLVDIGGTLDECREAAVDRIKTDVLEGVD